MKLNLIRQTQYSLLLNLVLLITFWAATFPAYADVNEKVPTFRGSTRYTTSSQIQELADERRLVVKNASSERDELEHVGRASLVGGRFQRKGGDQDDEQFVDSAAESRKRHTNLNTIQNEPLRAIADSHENPHAPLHPLEFGAVDGEEAPDVLNILRAVLGDHPALEALRRGIPEEMESIINVNANALTQGAQVQDFSSTGLDQSEYRLREVCAHNRYTLIEFWASWCAPCRVETPHIIDNYKAYNPKGFEVFAFSLDDDRDAWAKASQEDGIPWINTSDLKSFDSPIIEQFGIDFIPTNFLLDSKGVIVATDLRGEALKNTLAKLLGGGSPQGTR